MFSRYRIYNKRSKFDNYFREYTERFFCGTGAMNYDSELWLLFKAQGIAESSLRHDAVSSHGAVGIMQIMPQTWNILRKILEVRDDIEDPSLNIMAGIHYDKAMYKYWSFNRPEYDRLCLMFASYNAGNGNIQKAQNLASSRVDHTVVLWKHISKELINITGKNNSKETIKYVDKIFKIRKCLKSNI